MPTEPSSPGAPAELEIDIDIRNPDWTSELPNLRDICHRALHGAWGAVSQDNRHHDVSVVLANDAFQADLNAQYRGKTGSTNVLSFPSDIDPSHVPVTEAVPLGDIVLAFETLARESEALGVSLQDHFSHLLVHGMLHLIGFDHETENDATEMETLEVNVLAALGIANPYMIDATPVDSRQ